MFSFAGNLFESGARFSSRLFSSGVDDRYMSLHPSKLTAESQTLVVFVDVFPFLRGASLMFQPIVFRSFFLWPHPYQRCMVHIPS